MSSKSYTKVYSYLTSVPPLQVASAGATNPQAIVPSNLSIQAASYTNTFEKTFDMANKAQDDLYRRFFGREPHREQIPHIPTCKHSATWLKCPPGHECYCDDVPIFNQRQTWSCKNCNWLGYKAGTLCRLFRDDPFWVQPHTCYDITGYDASGKCIKGRPAYGPSCCLCKDISYLGYCTSGIVPGCQKPTPENPDPGDDGFGGNTGQIPQDPFQQIIIEDIIYSSNPEIVKIKNLGNKKQSMSGWRLVSHDGSIIPACPILAEKQTYLFPNNFELGPNQTALIASDTSAKTFVNQNSSSGLFWTTQAIWNNNSDIGILFNPSGIATSTYVYGDCSNNQTAGCVKVSSINFSPSGGSFCTTTPNLGTDRKCYPNEYMAIRSGVTGFFNVVCPEGIFCKSKKLDFFESIQPTYSINRWTYEDCPSLLGNRDADGSLNFTFEKCDCAPVVQRFLTEQSAVISRFTTQSAGERACSTSSNVSWKQPVYAQDYGFVAGNDWDDIVEDGDIETSCQKYQPYIGPFDSGNDPRNYCYDVVGANKKYSLIYWDYSRLEYVQGTSPGFVNLTSKYKLPGAIKKEFYTFEDCGIEPPDLQLEVVSSTLECLPQDRPAPGFSTEPPISACDPYITECLGENSDLKQFKNYGRKLVSIPYEIDFEFEVKITIDTARCCSVMGDAGCSSDISGEPEYRWIDPFNLANIFGGETYSGLSGCVSAAQKNAKITEDDIKLVKSGETVTKKFYLTRVKQSWRSPSYDVFCTVEVKRKLYNQVRPTRTWMQEPSVFVSPIETDGLSEIPQNFANECILDYSFSMPSPADSDNTPEADINEWVKFSLDFLKQEADTLKIAHGSNAGETLVSISTGSAEAASQITNYVNELLPSFRTALRNELAGVLSRYEYAIRNGIMSSHMPAPRIFPLKSVAYLILDFQTKARLLPIRKPVESCFGCGIAWQYLHDVYPYGSDSPNIPNPPFPFRPIIA